MKRMFILLAMFGVSSGYAADHPWKALEGCYDTVSRNGEPVEAPDPQLAGTSINEGVTSLVKAPDGSELEALNFSLFKKYTHGTYDYDQAYAFSDSGMGTYSQDSKGLHYVFEGRLKLAWDPTVFDMIERIDAQVAGAGVLNLHVYRKVPGTDGSFDTDDQYVLKSKPCYSDEPGWHFVSSTHEMEHTSMGFERLQKKYPKSFQGVNLGNLKSADITAKTYVYNLETACKSGDPRLTTVVFETALCHQSGTCDASMGFTPGTQDPCAAKR